MSVLPDSSISCAFVNGYEQSFSLYRAGFKSVRMSANTMNNEISSEILIATEVAQWLRVRPSTVYSWAASGRMPSLKLNGAIRFIRADIERWLNDSSKSRADSQSLPPRSIAPPQSPRISGQAIKMAGQRAIKRFTDMTRLKRNLRSEPHLSTDDADEIKGGV